MSLTVPVPVIATHNTPNPLADARAQFTEPNEYSGLRSVLTDRRPLYVRRSTGVY